MLKTIAIKALLGAGAIGVVGGSAALAGAPSITANLAAATTPKTAQGSAHNAKDRAHGTIIALSGTEMTVERQRRDAQTKAVTKDDVTFELSDKTVVYYFGSKDKHGTDVLKVGQDVGVRFVDSNGQKAARGVVILPDHRAGRIVSKDADGKSFTLRTRKGDLVKITTGPNTKFVEGTRRNHQTGSYADLKVGDRVLALGQEDSQHVFDASVVRSAHIDPSAKPNHATAAPAA
jgi:hypothetical protein